MDSRAQSPCRRVLRLVLPWTSLKDVPSYCRALEGEVAQVTQQAPKSIQLVSLDTTGTRLVADFTAAAPALLAAQLGAQLARGNVKLIAGGEVQLVMQRKAPSKAPDASAATKDEPPAVPLRPHWRPLPEPCHSPWEKFASPFEAEFLAEPTAKAKLNEEVESWLHLATQLAVSRKVTTTNILDRKVEQQKAVNRFRPMGLRLLRRFKQRYARKLQACLRVQRHWRSPRSLVRRALKRQRWARLQLQSWFRGIFGRRAAYRRYRALRRYGPVARLVLGPLHWLYRTRTRICAAICIATYWRGSCARAELAHRRATLRALQGLLRAVRMQQQLKNLWAASRVIQKQLRKFLHRRAVKRLTEMQLRLAQLRALAQQVQAEAKATVTKGGKLKPIDQLNEEGRQSDELL